MADTVIYEFDAYAEGVEEWSTNPGEMVDGVETDYASTTTDGDIQKLTENECEGGDLGTISKVEIRAYAYSDVDDQLILRPVFNGADDGDNHTYVPGVDHGWGAWQGITTDPNSPSYPHYEHFMEGDDFHRTIQGANWAAQTFTPAENHDVAYVRLKVYKFGSPGSVTVSIRATSEGLPTGEDLTSGATDGNTFTGPTQGEWRTVALTPYSLTASVMYAIVVRAIDGDASNYVRWRESGGGGYGGGGGYTSSNSGVDWAGGDPDFMFDEGVTVPPAWSWSDVQNLDCDVEQNDVAKGNTMYCGMVQIQVTYTAEAPPEGVAVQMMHYARMRRR